MNANLTSNTVLGCQHKSHPNKRPFWNSQFEIFKIWMYNFGWQSMTFDWDRTSCLNHADKFRTKKGKETRCPWATCRAHMSKYLYSLLPSTFRFVEKNHKCFIRFLIVTNTKSYETANLDWPFIDSSVCVCIFWNFLFDLSSCQYI